MLKSLQTILVLMFLSLLFLSCTSKDEKSFLQRYEKNKNYHHQLLKTEKVQLKIGGITKVILTATYTSKVSKSKNDEVFIVGIYIEESDVHSFTKAGFSLTLDGKKPMQIEALEKSSIKLKDVSFVSPWSQFYVVHFPHTSKKIFSLTLTSDLYGEGRLKFSKVAKYTFPKKGI